MTSNTKFNTDICHFVPSELVHDYKTDDLGIHSITASRYKKDKISFDILLKNNVEKCTNVKLEMFDEDNLIEYIMGRENFLLLKDKKNPLHQKIINLEYTQKDYYITIGERKNDDESPVDGVKFFEKMDFGYKNNKYNQKFNGPVILADTTGWVLTTLKQGSSKPNLKMYIFSPLVVRADSALKINIDDKKKMEPYFINNSGIQLVNVVDNEPYTPAPKDFLSDFTITTRLNKDKKLEQVWSGIEFHSQNTKNKKVTEVVRKVDGTDNSNDRPHTWKKMSPLINNLNFPPDPYKFEILSKQLRKEYATNTIFPADTIKLTSLARGKDQTNKTNREQFNVEAQSKRSGDWMPVYYIKDFNDKIRDKLQTYNDPTVITLLNNKTDFVKENMWIMTIDRPLLAYTLFNNLNCFFVRMDGTAVNFQAIQP